MTEFEKEIALIEKMGIAFLAKDAIRYREKRP